MPLVVPNNTGYDNAKPRQKSEGEYNNGPTRGTNNGTLSYKGKDVPLWVHNVSTDFSLAGSTGQSYKTRSFFAKNFQQPSLTIQTQFPSQIHMANAAELVRDSHLDTSVLMHLAIYARRTKNGPSSNIIATGYVQSMPRAHERFVYAPDVTFQFVVSQFSEPTGWADEPVHVRKLLSWHEIYENIKKKSDSRAFVVDDKANDEDDHSFAAVDDGKGGSRRT